MSKHSSEKGSLIAVGGFQNEKDVCNKFNNWESDEDAQKWLNIMEYKLDEIEYVKASVLHGYKADINVQIQIKLKSAIDTENIQVKLVSSSKGFNQIDKRSLASYREMWNIPDDVYTLLQYFTGELPPRNSSTKSNKRMFVNEFSLCEQSILLDWIKKNKSLITSDIIRGRGRFSAEWVLVVRKTANTEWALKNINQVIQHYSFGDVRISPRGSILIGKITMQRKGGDGGRETAKMLQFKIDPTEIFNI